MSSNTPSGDYTPTYASSLGLEGFDFDSEYGEGSAAARNDPKLPSGTRSLSTLPDGFVGARACECGGACDSCSGGFAGGDISLEDSEASDYGDALGPFVRTAARLTDLSWLEDAVQDPDRLPRSPNDAALKGLEDAWSTERRTNGLERVPAKEPPPPPPKSQTSYLPGDQYREIVASAVRRASFGEGFESILRDTATRLSKDLLDHRDSPVVQKVAASIRALRAEEGLLGRVYLRDSAFPDLLSGHWDREIRKKCASARYWLTRPGSKLSSRESYLGKKVVTEIPWGEAIAHYAPALAASGRPLTASTREGLRAALQAPARRTRPETSFPVPPRPTDGLTAKAAWELLRSIPAPERVRVEARERDPEPAARVTIERWRRAGLLSADDAKRILASEAPADRKLETGANLIVASGKTVPYEGAGVGVRSPGFRTTRDGAWAALKQAELELTLRTRADRTIASLVRSGALTPREGDLLRRIDRSPEERLRLAAARARSIEVRGSAPKTESRTYEGGVRGHVLAASPRAADGARAAELTESLRASALDRAREKVWSLVRANRLSYSDGERLVASDLSPKEMLRMASARVASPGAPPASVGKPQPARKYAGPVVRAAIPTSAPRKTSEIETARVLKWARREINEGAVGEDLTFRLAARFAEPIRRAAEEKLVPLRLSREGVAGHLYVEAEVYATPSGTTGCDAGGLVHRANAIPYVKPIDRCSGCTANVDGRCQKYAKEFLPAYSAQELAAFREETLRYAGLTDSEQTAEMFSPSEYGLSNDSLENVSYTDFPETESVGDFLFGGLTVDFDEEEGTP